MAFTSGKPFAADEKSGARGRIMMRPGSVMAERLGAWLVFLISLAVYVLTVEPTTSYWDCPEYILVGSKLEVGHPPGNPTWMLMANVASHFAASPSQIALCINLTSGIFTALSAMLLYLICLRLIPRGHAADEPRPLTALCGAATGALVFAFSDTAWFSAVEAEVYAFSIFCTALCVWLMLKWTDDAFTPPGYRLLILTAYITGLSIGVHQLNLLCLPTLALIYTFRRYPDRPCALRAAVACLLSLLLIACILYGVMPGVLDVASLFELEAVNALSLPFHTGEITYVFLTIGCFTGAILFTRSGHRLPAAIFTAAALWLSGLFSFCGALVGSAVIAVLAGAVLYLKWNVLCSRAYIALWCLTMLLTGYSTYSVILIRGAARTPVNEGAPTNIFEMQRYLGREQYGSKPLLYGRTPHSAMLREEIITGRGTEKGADYSKVWRDIGGRRYAAPVAGAVPLRERAALDSADRAFNRQYVPGNHAYIIAARKVDYRYPPELNMWLPRITEGGPEDIDAYTPWCGMTSANMDSIRVSYAVDSTGKAVGRLNPITGERVKEYATRPGYVQNFRYLAQYQMGYMYLRYLMWNFSGRQNDTHSTGEADNGNFITGIPAVDDAMLGPQGKLPESRTTANPGHHAYLMLPLLLGIFGLCAQLAGGRRGRRGAAIVSSLFIMTGLAIVIYVNQSPGEPRERDYSYVGSFFAFAIWAGYGAAALAALPKHFRYARPIRTAIAILCLALPAWMLASNMNDHDRSGRYITRDMAANLLGSLEPDAILFVNGDNYTFPLWYAREVEGIRPDVRVVNIAYLGTGWYARQMMMPDRKSAPLPMTATERDLAFDNYILSLYGATHGAPASRDAIEALRELYSSKTTATPRLNADSLLIRTPGKAPVKVALQSASGGKRTLQLSQLLMFDIVATNAASAKPRPVYWLSSLGPYHFSGLYPYTLDTGLVRRFEGREVSADSLDTSAFFNAITGHAGKSDTVARAIPGFRQPFAYGNAANCYVDPTSASMLGNLRQRMITLAVTLADEGQIGRALQVAETVCREMPFSTMEGKVYSIDYLLLSERTELARVFLAAADSLHRPQLKETARQLLADETARLGEWRRFYNSLTAGQKNVMSPRPRIEQSQLYAPIDLWIRAGFPLKELLSIPQIKGLDLKRERTYFERNRILRLMLHATRVPMPEAEEMRLYRQFRDLGGRASDLAAYPELTASPFAGLIPE